MTIRHLHLRKQPLQSRVENGDPGQHARYADFEYEQPNEHENRRNSEIIEEVFINSPGIRE